MRRIFVIFGLIVFTLQAQPSSKTVNTKFLALGDSYTIGESVAEKERWPQQLAKSLRKQGRKIDKPKIIGVTGWRTDQLKAAINQAHLNNEYGMVSLLIGVNNQYQHKSVESYEPEFEELLEMAITLAGGRKENVFVVSIPDYGYTPFGKPKQQEISAAIDQYNDANKTITEKMGVRYINITDLTRKGLDNPEYVAKDGLHPSGKMYALWVERMMPLLAR
ncbi:SGNH/GDSL hydrolase family protein [soil metagenome]